MFQKNLIIVKRQNEESQREVQTQDATDGKTETLKKRAAFHMMNVNETTISDFRSRSNVSAAAQWTPLSVVIAASPGFVDLLPKKYQTFQVNINQEKA